MNRPKKVFAFIDSGIDGAMSMIILKWIYGSGNVNYVSTFNGGFTKTYTEWINNNDINRYDLIFVIDLDIPETIIPQIDHKNICIVDHHTGNIDRKLLYKHATCLLAHSSSSSKILHNIYKQQLQSLTSPQKQLIALCDSCDTYKFNVPKSRDLLTVYNNSTTQKTKVLRFEADFLNGFQEFTDQQNNIILLYNNKVESVKKELEVYSASFNFNKKTYKGISTFCTSCTNEISDFIIDKYNADVAFIINSDTSNVSFRRSCTTDIDVSDLAKKLVSGNGYSYAAAGKLTDTFLVFSKIFTHVNDNT